MSDTLEILGKQTKNPRLQEVLQSAKRDVEGGATLSASLSKFPDIFENIYISLIKAGEASGNLDKTLLRLSENAEKRMEFSGAFKQAMIYPIIVLVAMAGVFVIMVVVVLPKLAEMYKDLGVDLPLPTKLMLGASDFIINFWWLALILIGGIVGAFYYFANTTFGIYKMAEISLKAPIFGKLNRDSDMGQFARTLSLLVSSGLPFLQCLDIVSGTITNIIFRDAIKEAAKQVERGVNLSVPLRANPLFPPVLSQMVVVGEETGKMDEVLLKVSGFFEKDVEKSLKNLTSALEPIIMIVLGIVVGVLIFSIITPIYKLTSSF
jgi:type IV pilus assembly protein PilC